MREPTHRRGDAIGVPTTTLPLEARPILSRLCALRRVREKVAPPASRKAFCGPRAGKRARATRTEQHSTWRPNRAVFVGKTAA